MKEEKRERMERTVLRRGTVHKRRLMLQLLALQVTSREVSEKEKEKTK